MKKLKEKFCRDQGEEREFYQLNLEHMKLLKEILEIKETKCHYCGVEICTDDKFSIFNKPTRIICSSILCMSECLEDDEKN